MRPSRPSVWQWPGQCPAHRPSQRQVSQRWNPILLAACRSLSPCYYGCAVKEARMSSHSDAWSASSQRGDCEGRWSEVTDILETKKACKVVSNLPSRGHILIIPFLPV